MLENNKQPAVDEVAEQARLLINALFNDRVAQKEVNVEENEDEVTENQEELIFDLSKDGEENYNFMISHRISPETMDEYMEVVKEIMSICPNLTEKNTKLFLNVFANQMDIAHRMYMDSYGREVAEIMAAASNSVSHDYMIIAGRIFNKPEAFRQALGEVDERIEHMIEYGEIQAKVTAIGLRTLQGEYRIFGYLMNKFCKMQHDFLTDNFGNVEPQNHVKILFQINRLARITCESLCILYQDTANK